MDVEVEVDVAVEVELDVDVDVVTSVSSNFVSIEEETEPGTGFSTTFNKSCSSNHATICIFQREKLVPLKRRREDKLVNFSVDRDITRRTKRREEKRRDEKRNEEKRIEPEMDEGEQQDEEVIPT